MTGYSEEFGKLKVELKQVEGWTEGTYNAHITYCNEIIAIKYHFHATYREQRKKIDPADALYNMTNGLDIITRCNIYKDLLDDIFNLEIKMTMKIKKGFKYKFDEGIFKGFVYDSLRETINVVHDDIQNIYMDLQYEALSKGKPFFIPLPDYTIQNITENYTEHTQNNDIVIKNNRQNETLIIIKKDIDLIIELIKELKAEKDKAQIITEYDKALIDNGSIDENLNAIHSAPKIAKFLIDEMLMHDLKPEILQRYKTNGRPFTLDTARKAVTYAKAK
jgi:hypothetical protein